MEKSKISKRKRGGTIGNRGGTGAPPKPEDENNQQGET